MAGRYITTDFEEKIWLSRRTEILNFNAVEFGMKSCRSIM